MSKAIRNGERSHQQRVTWITNVEPKRLARIEAIGEQNSIARHLDVVRHRDSTDGNGRDDITVAREARRRVDDSEKIALSRICCSGPDEQVPRPLRTCARLRHGDVNTTVPV